MLTLPSAAVARTAVLCEWNPLEGKDNFVTWTVKKLRVGEKVTMFEDQHISSKFANGLADSDAPDVPHVCQGRTVLTGWYAGR